jgi:hypothetical protein
MIKMLLKTMLLAMRGNLLTTPSLVFAQMPAQSAQRHGRLKRLSNSVSLGEKHVAISS